MAFDEQFLRREIRQNVADDSDVAFERGLRIGSDGGLIVIEQSVGQAGESVVQTGSLFLRHWPFNASLRWHLCRRRRAGFARRELPWGRFGRRGCYGGGVGRALRYNLLRASGGRN